MDGGGRLLRSLGVAGDGFFAEARPRFAGPLSILAGTAVPPPVRQRLAVSPKVVRAPRGGLGIILLALLFAGISVFGVLRGGEYQAYIDENGTPADIVAKALGFSIGNVTITGLKELTAKEILAGGDIGPKRSLALLDPSALRDRLRAMPLVKDATVRKLFPNDLAITIVEREPAALWPNEGDISLIAADGVPMDTIHDSRFNALPFVVGSKANEHLAEYRGLLSAAGDLSDRIQAGIYVGERRWTLKMDSGVQIQLPEVGAEEALRRLSDIERQSKVLEKDVLSIDLRIPGRITARLSEDAAAERAAALAKRPKAKAHPT